MSSVKQVTVMKGLNPFFHLFLRAPTALVSERLVITVILPLFAIDFYTYQVVIARVFQEQGPIDIDN